jgi:3-hydroxybutyryl-CoA dehydrogenase
MRIAVIGAGTMGNGIAQVCAFHGHQVYLQDVDPKRLEIALSGVRKSLGRVTRDLDVEARESKISETLARIEAGTDLTPLADVDFVIEAVFENLEIKCQVFEKLDKVCGPDCIMASNTSSISITRIAAITSRPASVIGMHFMNPVPVMKLVEVIRGLETADASFEKTKDLTLGLNKVPVEVKDFPGFVSNRILLPMLNEAMFVLMEGIARPEDVDTVFKLGLRHPMGPLELADFIGLDVCLDILDVLYEGFKDPKYRAAPILRQMVAAGRLGRKSGRGFYSYPAK